MFLFKLFNRIFFMQNRKVYILLNQQINIINIINNSCAIKDISKAYMIDFFIFYIFNIYII